MSRWHGGCGTWWSRRLGWYSGWCSGWSLGWCSAPDARARAWTRRGGRRDANPLVLRLASPNVTAEELGPFFDEVARRSSGTIRVDVHSGWRSGEIGSEAGLIDDVKIGRVDFGVVGSRAFDSAGTLRLRALQTPLLITSYAAEERVLTDASLVARMLDGFDAIGLTGLGIMPGPLQYPVGIDGALVSPGDYVGRTVGVTQSLVAEQTMRALGGHPARFPIAGEVSTFDGIVNHIGSVAGNQYDKVAKDLTADVVLWSRPLVLFANRSSFQRLSSDQQHILRQAVAGSFTAVEQAVRSGEAEGLGDLCRRGERLLTAGSANLAALRRAVQPVYDSLARDPGTAELIAAISAQVQGVTPEPAPSCQPSPPPGAEPSAASMLDGVYRVSTKPGDYDDPNPVPENYCTYISVFKHHHFAFTQQYRDACTWAYGTFIITADQMQWTFLDGGGTAPTHSSNKPGEVFTFTWSLYRDTLTLSAARDNPNSPSPFTAKPWQRTGTDPALRHLNQRCPPPPNALG